MAQRLRELRRDNYREKAPVFPSASGSELHPSNIRSRVLLPATKAAGLGAYNEKGEWRTWISFHTFRHTCASLLFEAGKDVKQTQQWLGHSTPSFTLDTYVHLMDDGLGDADFLDGVVGPSMPAQAPPR